MYMALIPITKIYGYTEKVWSVKWRPQKTQLVTCSGCLVILWEYMYQDFIGDDVRTHEFMTNVSTNTLKGSLPIFFLHSVILNGDSVFNSIGEFQKYTDPFIQDNNYVMAVLLDEYIPLVNETHHKKTIRNCAWSPNGEMLAIASFDATVSIWEENSPCIRDHYPLYNNWSCIAQLDAHDSEVKSIAWSSDSHYLASCSRDKTILIYGCDHIFDTNGPHCLTDTQPKKKIFSCLALLTGHTQDVKCVTWHPKFPFLYSSSYDNTIKIWATKNHCDNSLVSDNWICVQNIQENSSTVWDLSLSYSGRQFVSCSNDGTLKIWRNNPIRYTEKMPCLLMICPYIINWPWYITYNGLTLLENWIYCGQIDTQTYGPIYSVAWHPIFDVIAAAISGGIIHIYSYDTSLHSENKWILQKSYENIHKTDINCIQWKSTPETDGTWLLAAASDDSTISVHKYCVSEF